ncbi:unnamed protein product [Closterium sp. NIES-65]|nr:unnamed protein product [Closterium sp. NIES-65]
MLDAWTVKPRDESAAVPSKREGGKKREEGGGRRDDMEREHGVDVVDLVGSGGARDREDVEASYDGQQQLPLLPQWRRRQRRQRKKLHDGQEKARQQQQQQQQASQVVCQGNNQSNQGGVAALTAAAQPRQPLFFSKLQHLELADVSALHHLPRGVLQHHSLKHLVLDGYSGASLSAACSVNSNFPSLRELWLQDLPLLHELPPSFSCLSSLHRLVIARCHRLISLPDCLPELPLLRDLALVINRNLTVPRGFLPQLHSVRRLVVHRGWENKTSIVHLGQVRSSFGLPPRVKELHTDDFGSDVFRLHELERLEVTEGNLAKFSISEIRVLEELVMGRRMAASEKHGSKHFLPCLQRLSLANCEVGPRFPPWMRHLTSLQHLSLTHIHRHILFCCASEQANEPRQLQRMLKAYVQEEEHWENLVSLQRVDRCACCPLVLPSEWQPLVRVVKAATAEAEACGGDVIRRAGFVLGDSGAGLTFQIRPP